MNGHEIPPEKITTLALAYCRQFSLFGECSGHGKCVPVPRHENIFENSNVSGSLIQYKISPEENALLKELISSNGTLNPKQIANMMPSHIHGHYTLINVYEQYARCQCRDGWSGQDLYWGNYPMDCHVDSISRVLLPSIAFVATFIVTCLFTYRLLHHTFYRRRINARLAKQNTSLSNDRPPKNDKKSMPLPTPTQITRPKNQLRSFYILTIIAGICMITLHLSEALRYYSPFLQRTLFACSQSCYWVSTLLMIQKYLKVLFRAKGALPDALHSMKSSLISFFRLIPVVSTMLFTLIVVIFPLFIYPVPDYSLSHYFTTAASRVNTITAGYFFPSSKFIPFSQSNDYFIRLLFIILTALVIIIGLPLNYLMWKMNAVLNRTYLISVSGLEGFINTNTDVNNNGSNGQNRITPLTSSPALSAILANDRLRHLEHGKNQTVAAAESRLKRLEMDVKQKCIRAESFVEEGVPLHKALGFHVDEDEDEYENDKSNPEDDEEDEEDADEDDEDVLILITEREQEGHEFTAPQSIQQDELNQLYYQHYHRQAKTQSRSPSLASFAFSTASSSATPLPSPPPVPPLLVLPLQQQTSRPPTPTLPIAPIMAVNSPVAPPSTTTTTKTESACTTTVTTTTTTTTTLYAVNPVYSGIGMGYYHHAPILPQLPSPTLPKDMTPMLKPTTTPPLTSSTLTSPATSYSNSSPNIITIPTRANGIMSLDLRTLPTPMTTHILQKIQLTKLQKNVLFNSNFFFLLTIFLSFMGMIFYVGMVSVGVFRRYLFILEPGMSICMALQAGWVAVLFPKEKVEDPFARKKRRRRKKKSKSKKSKKHSGKKSLKK